jgi:hypothetical protein
MEIRKTEIELLDFGIEKRQVILQDHILKSFTEFPDILHDKIQLQRFLGCLNYICPFYKGQADDILIL